LISEYRSLKQDTNSNYNYYLGRLYSNIISFPFEGFLYDSINKKLKDPILYSNYIDSAIYFNNMALSINPNNLFAIYKIANLLEEEQYLYNKKSKECKNMPFYPDRKNDEFQKTCNYIINNAVRFLPTDTSLDKYKSRYVVEFAFLFLNGSIKKLDLDINDEKNISNVLNIQNMILAINKYSEPVLLDKKYYENEKNLWLPIIAQVKKENERRQEEALILEKLANLDLKHKYFCVNVSANVTALIDLSGWDIFSYVSGDLDGNIFFKGHGDWKRPYTDQITLTPTSGITPSSKLTVGLNSSGKIILTLPNGTKYIQDDDGYYLKNRISTPL
jgi:hypothetical protein